MPEIAAKIDEHGQPVVEEARAHPMFSYHSGYKLCCFDFGESLGVKLELSYNNDDDTGSEIAAIHLPPTKVTELADWLNHTLGQEMRKLPNGLYELLRRMRYTVEKPYEFQRGDKVIIRHALETLHAYQRDIRPGPKLKEVTETTENSKT